MLFVIQIKLATGKQTQEMNTPQHFRENVNHTDRELRKMLIWLIAFFASLLIGGTLIILNAQSLAKSVPFSAEERFIKPYEQFIESRLNDGEFKEVDGYLQSLANNLAASMDLPEDYILKVHYLDGLESNAFATLGGHIFVYGGLIKIMPDENSLAMILAHEIAHIKNRDPAASLGRGIALQILYSFMTNDYSQSLEIAGFGGDIGLAFFSRAQEQQADKNTLKALTGYYGHVGGYDTFFASLLEGNTDQSPEWLSTHPGLEVRLDYLNEKIDQDSLTRNGERKQIPQSILDLINAKESEL